MTRMEGVAVLDDQFAIITSQCSYPHDGDQPDARELDRWFRGLGFKPVTAGIFYRSEDNIAIFDVKPANVIRSGGILRPVDVIPIKLSGVLASALKEATA